ncbi:uncharacterized protein G2W53_005807 [Senna tora]|uniref:Uncharacterized protein n=1 Tax=Senna tora TaxID=362788 RepID=A0A834X447_9FABA|nr:uncharacterized protein G2W53_005807 [Senna tora]
MEARGRRKKVGSWARGWPLNQKSDTLTAKFPTF